MTANNALDTYSDPQLLIDLGIDTAGEIDKFDEEVEGWIPKRLEFLDQLTKSGAFEQTIDLETGKVMFDEKLQSLSIVDVDANALRSESKILMLYNLKKNIDAKSNGDALKAIQILDAAVKMPYPSGRVSQADLDKLRSLYRSQVLDTALGKNILSYTLTDEELNTGNSMKLQMAKLNKYLELPESRGIAQLLREDFIVRVIRPQIFNIFKGSMIDLEAKIKDMSSDEITKYLESFHQDVNDLVDAYAPILKGRFETAELHTQYKFRNDSIESSFTGIQMNSVNLVQSYGLGRRLRELRNFRLNDFYNLARTSHGGHFTRAKK